MPSFFNLESVPAKKRWDVFRDVVASTYVPVDVKCEQTDLFDAWIDRTQLGEVSVDRAFLGHLDVDRNVQHIAQSADDPLVIAIPLSGSIFVNQDSKNALIGPGEFYVMDPARPYRLTIVEDMTFLSFQVPRKLLTTNITQIEHVTGIGFNRDLPYSRLATDFALSLNSVSDAIKPNSASRIGAIAVDLFTMALWERLGEVRTHSTTHRSAQFRKAISFIEEHLADEDLNLQKVALSLGISTRYLNGLFSEGGLDYRRYVLEQRLTRCAKELTSGCVLELSIADTAYKWGFSDNAHFSRTFKTHYGMSPRDYRAVHRLR